jgi:predicted secreted protein
MPTSSKKGRENMLAETIALLLLSSQAATAGVPAPAANARPALNPDQMICRAPEAVLGSRIARRRICRTRAEWQAFEGDRAQLRRDIQNSSKGTPTDD